ncbi:MAG: DUF2334 domain-containing protein [Candidatus Hydrothermarchaeales archaeon]
MDSIWFFAILAALFSIFIYLTRYYYRDLLLGPPVDFLEDQHIEVSLYPRGHQAALVLTCDDVNAITKPEKIKKILELVESYGVKVVFFVVPFFKGRNIINRDSETVKLLKDADKRGHEVALHGLTHSSPTRRITLRRVKELGHLPYSEQKRRIRKGKRIMEQATFNVAGFRSPGFSANMDTLMILDSEEFSYSSETRLNPLMLPSNKRLCESLYYPYHPKDLSLLDFTANGDYFWGYSKIGKGDLESLKRRFNRFYDNGGVFVLLSHVEPLNSGNGLKILEGFLKYANDKNLWKTNLKEIAEWWRAREMLYATTYIKDKTLLITLEKDSEFPLRDLTIKFKPNILAKHYKIMDINESVIREGSIHEGETSVSL